MLNTASDLGNLRAGRGAGWKRGRKEKRKWNLNVETYAVLMGGFTRRRQVIKMSRKEIRLSDADWIHLAHHMYPVSASCEYDYQHSGRTNDEDRLALISNY